MWQRNRTRPSLQLQQHAVALRDRRTATACRGVRGRRRSGSAPSRCSLRPSSCSGTSSSPALRRRRRRQCDQQRRNARERHDVVDVDVIDGVLAASTGNSASLGILHDRRATQLLDRHRPAVPSSRLPVRMTPIAAGPYTWAADRNSGSIAGRKRFSRGPFVTRTRPGSTTQMTVGRRDVDASRLAAARRSPALDAASGPDALENFDGARRATRATCA